MEEETKISSKSLKNGLAVLRRYVKQYRKETITLSSFGIISAIGNGVVPYITGRFFDAIISPATQNFFGYIMPLYAALLIIWAVIQIITYLIDWQLNIKSENFSNTVWVDYWAKGFSHLFELPMAFHKNEKIGEVGEKINRAAFSLETIVGRIIIDLAPQFLSIMIAIGIGFSIKPSLALILLAGVVAYVFILVRSVRPLASIQKEYQTHLFRAFGDGYDLVGNTQTIKQATAETYERNRLTDLLTGNVLRLWNVMNRVWSNLTLAQRVIILATQLSIFVISVYFITRNQMTIGELLAFNAYATMVFGPFVVVGRNWQVIQNGIIQLDEAERIIAEPSEVYEPKDVVKLDTIKGDVKFDHVDFYYDQKSPVLSDISFSVKHGEIVALVGESGVGKSTLIELISGYHFSKKGTVTIDSVDVRKLNLRFLRKYIGIVPQEVVLFNESILHNISYGSFDATMEKVTEAARQAHALDFIEKFPEKWKQVVGERGVKLSVGQKQRIAIARAILRNPSILILDEPTSALDAATERIITTAFEKLMQGKTTFIVAHRLSTVRKAKKILVFKEGRIIETGTHDELLKIEGGEYRRLYEYQIGLHA